VTARQSVGRVLRARRWPKRLAWWWLRSLSLSQRLLVGAVVVVGFAMIALGYWTGQYIQLGITRGVAATAAASIDALISFQLANLDPERPLSPSVAARFDEVFAIGNDASLTRLLQIRIHELDGSLLYDSADGLADREDTGAFVGEARAGAIVANIRDVDVEAVGSLGEHTLAVLKVYAPIHRPASTEINAVAELYFSAASLTELQARAQQDVWLLVAGVGAAVVALLYLLVSRTSRTIALQRARLAENLDNSRRLAGENRALHASSEELRLVANSANERLLAQVGSDIHDGPIQLLSLIILRLTGQRGSAPVREADREQTVALATEAMEDLRNISNGLVLPELTDADLNETLSLAITRHENLTGSIVTSAIAPLSKTASSAVKACAYRIVQEGLNNAFRHGGGREQGVAARCEAGVLTIEVTNPDNPAEAADGSRGEGKSLGLQGMRFRVESIGGDLRLDIGNGPVARIVATIPLEPAGRH
jgi:signal transduction histidine kinase